MSRVPKYLPACAHCGMVQTSGASRHKEGCKYAATSAPTDAEMLDWLATNCQTLFVDDNLIWCLRERSGTVHYGRPGEPLRLLLLDAMR